MKQLLRLHAGYLNYTPCHVSVIVMYTVVAGPVEWGVSTAVHDDRHDVLGVCGLQQRPQHCNVTARRCKMHGCAPPTVPNTHTGPML